MKRDRVTHRIREWYVQCQCLYTNEDLCRMMDLYIDKDLGQMIARDGLLLLQFLRCMLSTIGTIIRSLDSHVIAGVPLKDDSHLLEFVYENIINSSDFKSPYKRKKNNRRVSRITLPRAVQLKGKGVKFAPNKGPLNEIRFNCRNLTLYLPTIEMDDKADAVLRNLVVFETSKPGKESQPLRSYVNLMQRLIDTVDAVGARGLILLED